MTDSQLVAEFCCATNHALQRPMTNYSETRRRAAKVCRVFNCRRGVMVSIIGLINEVNQHRARLVLGWVTVFGWVNHLM